MKLFGSLVALDLLPFVTSGFPQFSYADTTVAYDYIIVGSGPGGLVVGDRLSEAGKNVLVLERGGPSTGETGGTYVTPWANGTDLTKFDIPGLFTSMFTDSNHWYWCNDMSDSYVYAGCLMGGGTSINGGLYWYPTASDFSIDGGWPSGWQDYQPYADKMKSRLPSTDSSSTDGIRYLPQSYNVVSELLNHEGYSAITINDNPNSKDRIYGWSSYNFQGGKRAGPIVGYWRYAKDRKNFKSSTYTMVHSVVRNGTKIIGVRTNNTSLAPDGVVPLNPGGRVILSAGSFGSPRILIQSGIGPTDMISLVKNDSTMGPLLPSESDWINLPVGYNLLDHPSVSLIFTHPSIDSYDNWIPIWTNPRPADAAQYVKDQSGVFASSVPKLNFWTALLGPDGKKRWVEGTVGPGASGFQTSLPYNASQLFIMVLNLAKGVTSSGRMGLDTDLKPKVLVTPWFTDSADKETMVSALDEIISGVGSVQNLTLLTPDNTTTVEDYINGIPAGSLSSSHWMGTNKIATSSAEGVVDVNTKVFGTDNLFVVDASIIPSTTMGNPHGMIMAMAEQASAKILALP